MKKLMIYGATGYTGRMAAQHAAAAGTPLVLAGRSEDTLAPLAVSLGAEYRVFPLSDTDAIDASLAGIGVLLNCAGPFTATAAVLMQAAIRNGVHYLDIAAELEVYRLAQSLDSQAVAAGVMLLPGGGGRVAMLDCLAGHALAATDDPVSVRIALQVSGGMSRGSAISAMESVTAETLVSTAGRLVASPAGSTRKFDPGTGEADFFRVTLPNLFTLWQSARVPEIETYVHVTAGGFPQGDISTLPDGPDEQERLANRYQAVAEVTTAGGKVVRSLLDTVNGYTFTAMAAAQAGRRILDGESRPGFLTPLALFGNDFAGTIADTTIVTGTEPAMQQLAGILVHRLNTFDIPGALALFTPDAVISDVSVGDAFAGTENIRRYFEQFFAGYHTVSRRISFTQQDSHTGILRLSFSGDFGHETGILRITTRADGLIRHIDADLE